MAKGNQLVDFFLVDAFTETPFFGNPAAVCLLRDEREESWLQSLAAEFNISETCYLTPVTPSANPRFRLRWFTPVGEVNLCGHATLAASHALFSDGLVESDLIEFETLSGVLTARRVPDNGKKAETKDSSFLVELNFPAISTIEFSSVANEMARISNALNCAPIVDIRRTTTSDDLFVVLNSGEAVMEFQPDYDLILKCPGRGIIVSGEAPLGSGFDVYSRFFCPKYGINEDPVCGSAHCALATYWSKKLQKSKFSAFAASPRTGSLNVELDEKNGRVMLRGKAVTVMRGSVLI
ncbi:Uncharacterized isomerase BH0283 [Linum perenne]